jgi:two-component system, cell cycle sensor histidine kinase and response regulator CckA
MKNAGTPGGGATETQGNQGIEDRSRTLVMVVEDDEVLQWLLSGALNREGFKVLNAANGVDALQLFRENAGKVWLVVSDIFMPMMDGLTAATEMLKIDDNVFFIFMSGYDSEHIDKIGIKLADIPRSDFFRKPFDLIDIVNRMKALERYRKGTENEA